MIEDSPLQDGIQKNEEEQGIIAKLSESFHGAGHTRSFSTVKKKRNKTFIFVYLFIFFFQEWLKNEYFH